MIRIGCNSSGFNAQLERLLGQARRPRAVLMAAGRQLANDLRAHFRMKDATPNKLSPWREHFWLQVRRSVNSPVRTGYNTVSVTVSDPRIAQKVFGGTITAKRAKALTIPVGEKAYGRPAVIFEAETGLKLFLLGKKDGGRGALAAKIGDRIEVEYLLRKSVHQDADPTALPEMSDLEAAIIERAQTVVNRQNETQN